MANKLIPEMGKKHFTCKIFYFEQPLILEISIFSGRPLKLNLGLFSLHLEGKGTRLNFKGICWNDIRATKRPLFTSLKCHEVRSCMIFAMLFAVLNDICYDIR